MAQTLAAKTSELTAIVIKAGSSLKNNPNYEWLKIRKNKATILCRLIYFLLMVLCPVCI
jgi:hypothetical protein